MPKKRRSSGKGNVTPIKVTEHYTWKCDVPGCKVKGTVYTKKDARDALTLHKAFTH